MGLEPTPTRLTTARSTFELLVLVMVFYCLVITQFLVFSGVEQNEVAQMTSTLTSRSQSKAFGPILAFTFLLLAATPLMGWSQQSAIDSMEAVLPSQTGEEKLKTLGDLAFQYCFLNTDKALAYGKMELELAEELGDSAKIAMAWNDLAAAYVSRGEFETSILYNEKAMQTRQRLGDSIGVASSLSKIGHAEMELGRLDAALVVLLRAATIFEAEEQYRNQSLVENNIGTLHQKQGNSAKAIEYFEKAVATANRIDDVYCLIGPKSNLALEYFNKGSRNKSQPIFLELARLMEETGMQQNMATIKMNLGVCYMDTAAFDSALYYFFAADTLFQVKNDLKGLSMLNVDMGICYTRMRAFPQAKERLDKGMAYARQTGSNLRLEHACDGYSGYALAQGDYKSAFEYQQRAREYQRLVFNEEVNAKVAEMQTRYETEKKEKELAVRDKELAASALRTKNQQLAIVLLAGGLLLVLTFVGLLLRNQKLRRERMLHQAKSDLQEERLRISRDLHDNIGAELTLISSSLEVQAMTAPDDHAKGELANIGSYARNAMAQLRETIWAIRNESISVEALSLRLMDYAAKLCKPAGIVSKVDVAGLDQKSLSPTLTIHLYRMCQEAIHNAVKYAQCGKLTLHLQADAKRLAVEIRDDGKGFDRGQGGSGYGLQNMEARAAELGGTFALQSEPGSGTVVRLSVPC